MFLQKVLHAVDCQPLAAEAGKQHILLPSLGFPQPSLEHFAGGFRQRSTAELSPLANHLHVGTGNQDQVLPFESGHFRHAQPGLYRGQDERVNRLDECADRSGVSVFDMEGSEPLIRRMRALAENPELATGPRQVLAGVLENHRRHLAARKPDTVAVASPAPEAIPSPPARKPVDEALARHSAGLGFAVDGEAGPARDDTPGMLSALRRAAGRIAGGRDYHDRMETEMHARQALERWEALRGEWNRLLEQADREGVHVIYTDGYDNLYEKLNTLSRNRLLDYDISSEMRAVLSKLDRAVSNRRYVDTWRGLMTGELDSREALEAEAAGRGVAVPDYGKYDTWRDLIDDAADRCREILAARHEYGIHLDDIARRGESLASALSRVHGILREDDRHLAAALVQQRKGEDVAEREKRIARLLDDPGKLRELRQKRAEQKAGKKQRKDWSMGMGM